MLLDAARRAGRDRRLRDGCAARGAQGARTWATRRGCDRRGARRLRLCAPAQRKRLRQRTKKAATRRYALPPRRVSDDGAALAAPVRAKRVWFRLPGELVPAWYVEVQVREAAAARASALLVRRVRRRRVALVPQQPRSDVAFVSRVRGGDAAPPAAAGPRRPRRLPASDRAAPTASSRPFVTANLVTLENAPFSRNDPWLAAGATRTIGNNVEAFADICRARRLRTRRPPMNATSRCRSTATCTRASTSANTFDHALQSRTLRPMPAGRR